MKKKLSASDLSVLDESMHYMHMEELKNVCKQLSLPTSGQKGEILQRIYYFCENDVILTSPKIPEASIAKQHQNYPLHPKTLILKGSYKNDEATRNFMKSIVGEHFHFTAFGQDWIKQCWLAGTPPTYKEFADFWQKEYELRKYQKAKPKEEWAYLNFLQRKYENSVDEDKEKETDWEKERTKHCLKAWQILEKLNKEKEK